MRPQVGKWDAWIRRFVFAWGVLWLGLLQVPLLCAQLAITEVMSNASTNQPGNQGADFWELTNFGTNAIDLSGYSFIDSDTDAAPWVLPADGILLAPNESILFVRTNAGTTPTEADFRAWWGLPSDTPQVRCYPRPGFSSYGDSLRVYDAGGQLVDQVDFGPAWPGFTLTYDTHSGEFGRMSAIGVCGAYLTPDTGDVGSPGSTCGPVPLSILEPPTNLVVTAGMEAVFSVRAAGLPRPRYQWTFNDEPIAGATQSALVLSNVQPDQAGLYAVELVNGLASVRTRLVTLIVSTNPTPPQVLVPPRDRSAFVGQTARFSVSACGYPPPQLQWYSNGVALTGQTSRILEVTDCTLEMNGTLLCVQASNPLGTTSACAGLTVTLKPDLRFTEVMARRPIITPQHKDWFELTNCDTNAVNLLGYRFSPKWDLADAHEVTEPAIIQPGESVIFADILTRAEFAAWWGADNLPPNLQVITWTGFGISPAGGEMLYLWNPSAEAPEDATAYIFINPSLPGVSLSFDFEGCYCGCNSTVGERGAFHAAQGNELGSPGYVANPELRFLSIQHQSAGLLLKWRAVEDRAYRLFGKDAQEAGTWFPLATQIATNATVVFRDTPPGRSRFYRVQELSAPTTLP